MCYDMPTVTEGYTVKKLICTVFGVLLIALAVSGCNTMRGIGRDVSSAGSGIQRAASN